MSERDEVQKACPTCGVSYCLPKLFDDERREDHRSWYCPNGHSLYYPAESPKEREIRLLKEKLALRDWGLLTRDREIGVLKTEVRSLRAQLAWARRRAVLPQPPRRLSGA